MDVPERRYPRPAAEGRSAGHEERMHRRQRVVVAVVAPDDPWCRVLRGSPGDGPSLVGQGDDRRHPRALEAEALLELLRAEHREVGGPAEGAPHRVLEPRRGPRGEQRRHLVHPDRVLTQILVQPDHPIRSGGDHAMIGNHDQVHVAPADPVEARDQPSDQPVGCGDGRVGLRRVRAMVVSGVVHQAEVEREERGAAVRGRMEQVERPCDPGGVRHFPVIWQHMGGPDSPDRGLAPGPEQRGGAPSLPLRRHPDRLRQIEAGVPHGRTVPQAQPAADVGGCEYIPHDPVMRRVPPGDQGVVIGKGLGREHRHQRRGAHPLARQA